MDPEKQQLSDDGISVSLTPSPLDITFTMATVRNPEAGAIVLFAGNSSQEHVCGVRLNSIRHHS